MSLEKTARSLSPDVSQSFAQKKARVENEVYIRLQFNPLSHLRLSLAIVRQ